MTRDGLRIVLGTSALLWLGLLVTPVVLAEGSWHAVDQYELDFLFVDTAVSAPSLDAVHIAPVSVWYPTTDTAAALRADSLRKRAQQVFSAAFTDAGMAVVDDPDTASVTVDIQLIDLKTATRESEWLELARSYRFRIAAGRVTLVAEIRDAVTGRTLARVADLEDAYIGNDAPAAALERALATWGIAVAASMDRAGAERRFARLRN